MMQSLSPDGRPKVYRKFRITRYSRPYVHRTPHPIHYRHQRRHYQYRRKHGVFLQRPATGPTTMRCHVGRPPRPISVTNLRSNHAELVIPVQVLAKTHIATSSPHTYSEAGRRKGKQFYSRHWTYVPTTQISVLRERTFSALSRITCNLGTEYSVPKIANVFRTSSSIFTLSHKVFSFAEERRNVVVSNEGVESHECSAL